MTEPAGLFARLTGEVEDLHILAIEGQAADLPIEASRMLAAQFCTGLHRVCDLLARIGTVLEERS